MTDSSGSQDIVSYEKQNNLEDRDTSLDDKDADFESRLTTSGAVPLSPIPDGGWRAWSVLLGVYVLSLLTHGINLQNNDFADGSPNFALLGAFSCSFLLGPFYDVTM